MGVLSDVYDAVRDTVEEYTDLAPSPVLFDARNVPDTNANATFCVDMQSQNTGKYRDRTQMRLAHTVSVSFLYRQNLHREVETYTKALDTEEAIIDALLVQSRNEDLRFLYDRTTRQPTQSREYLYVQVRFNVEGDYAVTS